MSADGLYVIVFISSTFADFLCGGVEGQKKFSNFHVYISFIWFDFSFSLEGEKKGKEK